MGQQWVTATLYGVFIVGVFAALSVVTHLFWIYWAVAALALVFGLVNIKDYFAFGKGLSFTIPERFKPRIYRGSRSLRQQHSLPWLLLATVLMASGVALIELPCTAGFPVIWSSLLSTADVSGMHFAGLLLVYLSIYLGIEMMILVAALVTLQPGRFQERHGRILKLVGGMVMIALALVLLIDPSVMESLTGSLVVVSLALILALAVFAVDRLRRGTRTE